MLLAGSSAPAPWDEEALPGFMMPTRLAERGEILPAPLAGDSRRIGGEPALLGGSVAWVDGTVSGLVASFSCRGTLQESSGLALPGLAGLA